MNKLHTISILAISFLTTIYFISCQNSGGLVTPISFTPGDIYYSRFRFNPQISYSVYSVASDGTNLVFITHLGLIMSEPFKNKMALAKADSLYYINRIYIANLDGSGAVEIPVNGYYPIIAKLSPDANKILFTCDEGDFLCIVNSDGTRLIELSHKIRGTEQAPAFSPDSKQIAFIETEPDFSSFLTIINIDGTNALRIKDSIYYSNESRICWSPDGGKLAFDNTDKNGKTSIFTINRDGTDYFNLTASNHFDYSPDWSPDGTRILYNKYNLSGVPDIAVINSDGTGKRNLTNTDVVYERNPRWSPSGEKILYSSSTMSLLTSLKVLDINSGLGVTIADSTGTGFWNYSK